MSPRAWSMTPLELTVLWHAIGREILPYPLQYRSTESTAEEYQNAYKAAAARIRTIFDADMYVPLRILIEPEARVEVAGFAAARTGVMPGGEPDPTALIRLHAAVAGRFAVILNQESSPDPFGGGAVRMLLVRADTLPGRVMTILPATRRGSAQPFRIHRDDLDGDRPHTTFNGDEPLTPRTEAERFFERPRTTLAHIAVYPGPAYDNRPTPARDFHVMDYPDGRYDVHSAAAVQAAPADTAHLTAHLKALIARTLQQYREENDPAYT